MADVELAVLFDCLFVVWQTKLESMRVQLGKTQKELQLRFEENCSLSKEMHEAGRQINSLSCQVRSPFPDFLAGHLSG